MVFETSLLWIILAVVAYMLVGAVWYSPLLFAKPWMKAIGKAKGQLNGSPLIYVYTVAAELVIVLGLAWLSNALGITDAAAGAWLGAKVWLVFAATTSLINRLFQGINPRLYAIDLGYHLAGMIVAGALVSL